ncbi:PorT family protein [Chitinophaga silvatica]|uniref:PorT family protein n=1 Tax=Chitinophaga silvatica TaxID=2282649 RepID=A0A3E1YAB9_9BACT|nr:porin family protein [Chitinophaga silvatica]RFS22608.1 PorT family protein [Chitinophaga silvatica]
MKKTLLVMIALVAAKVSIAQYGANDKRVQLGFTASPLISVLNPQESGVKRNSVKVGFNFGLMADLRLNESGTYSLSSGFQALFAGSTLKYDAGVGLSDFKAVPSEYNMKLTYVEIPLALKLKTKPVNDMTWFGQFGTFFDFPVAGRANVISAGQTFNKVNILPEMNRINIGMLIGAGVEYPLGETLRGMAGITYQNGFVDVTRNKKWNDGRINMNSFALRLGIYF